MLSNCIRLSCAMCLSVVLVATTMAAAPDPIVYYSLGELDAMVIDASGNGYDGTPQGAIVLSDEGYIGSCYQFNGSDTSIELQRPIQDAFTLAGWLKTATPGLDGTMAYHGSGLFWSDVGGSANDFVVAVLGTKLSFNVGNPNTTVISNGDIVTDEWVHVAAVRDVAAPAIGVYINGTLDNRINHPNGDSLDRQPLLVIGGNPNDSRYYTGLMDEVKVFDMALSESDIQGTIKSSVGIAGLPSPEDGVNDVPRDVTLNWTPGEFAVSHDLYRGDSFGDVDTAIVPTAAGLDANSFDPGRLEFGETYYWRVDEVNAAPDNTIFKGEVWSFEVEPLSIPIETITATASAANPGTEPSKTIDGSGLNEMDQHLTDSAAMWQATGVAGTWIQYDFDKAYKLHEMLVWNSNTMVEPFIGFGAKEITIETSTDGTTWTALAGVHQLAKGTGLADYTANTTVDLGGATAKYVKLTMVSAQGLAGQIGLSEVRFLAIPTLAREPQPTSGAAVNSADIMLSWRAGREAVEHNVLLGTDASNLSLLGTVTDNQIDSGALAYATTYYWSVTEVNQAETPTEHAGEVWSFTTPDYGVVDDFETYSGKEGEEIFLTWFDGYGGDDSLGGSTTGHIDGPFVETTTVKSGTGGSQSMPVFYDNDGNFINIDGKTSSLTFSEVVRDFKSPQDWILGSPTTLVVSFHGTPGNTGQLYVKINGVKVVYTDQADAIKRPYWTQWNINLSSLGIDLKSVTQLSLGVEGGSGLVYIDDIFLYRTAPLPPQEQIWLQAEEADTITAPMTVYIDDPAAMGGRFIGTTDDVGNSSGNPPSPDGTATYTFTVKGGVYKINGRVIIPAGDSFWVRIVGATTQTSNHSSGWVRWSDPPNGTDWHWNEVFSAEDGNEVVEFTLAAGTHTLEIGYREDGAMLDAVVIESID
jgi:hypothetical protein